MVPFFTMTLVLSVLGIGVLLVLKQIEVASGVVLLSALRPKINRFFKTCLVLVERVLPGLLEEGGIHVFRRLRAAITVALAHAALWLEIRLKAVLKWLRVKLHAEPHRGEASAFLKEVGEYKKQLENEVEDDRALY